MNIKENNKEVSTHKSTSIPLIFFAVAFISAFFVIYVFNSGRSSEFSESRLIEKNIKSSIIQWSYSQTDRVSARASILGYYQCINSSAGFSYSDCLKITGGEDFIGAVVDAINKTKASQKVKNRFLVSPGN